MLGKSHGRNGFIIRSAVRGLLAAGIVDHTYYIILNRVKKKYPDYTTAQLYAVASALRLKALEQNNAQA